MRPFKISRKSLCVSSVIASLGLMFSTSVFAQANGAKIVSEIDVANNVLDFALTKNVCSTLYISNATLRADCAADITAMSNLVSAWQSNFDRGTLTVAYDEAVENDLYDYEANLRAVLNDSGFTYNSAQIGRGSLSPDTQLSPDEISPDGAAVCAFCGGAAAAGYYVCLTTIPAPPVALVCGIGVALGYLACAWDACPIPPDPPKSCPA